MRANRRPHCPRVSGLYADDADLTSFFYVISLLFFGRTAPLWARAPFQVAPRAPGSLATVLAGEITRRRGVCLPLLMHGVETEAAADYYVRSCRGTLFIPGIPVAITTLLSCAHSHQRIVEAARA